jgi:hypothetical protein
VRTAIPILPTLVWSIGVAALLGGGPRPTFAADPPAEVIEHLDRAVVPSSTAPCPDVGLYSLTRPDPAGQPTVVGLAAFFQDVATLSDVEQTLDSDLYLMARWRDPRLADPARGDAAADCPVPTGRLWMPALEPESLRARQAFYPDRFFVDGRGTVTWLRRLWLKVSYPLNFRDFPIDRHRWVFTIWPVFSRAEELVFYPLKRKTLVNDHLSIQGWRVDAARAEASTAPRVQQSGTFARFQVQLDLTRDWSFHAWRLGVPLVLIVLMAYGVYFIPATAVPQQIGLGTTSMLTLIAYMLTLGNTLPRIPYLTRADQFFVGSAILVFLGLLKAVLTLVVAGGPKAHLVARADRWGRWLFPIAILVNFALAFLG